ncbi:condensation domain-containing protein [Cellulomonas sp. JZ18]|uniref:condensation domain-containing protein n=1 Tax=Cellulomonas sp. JZ18 TaxID=2654191 RepID=UPI0018AF715E|nr:condensation domain-containing protein [Cellulomonas sp. JZ18]
MTAAATAAHVEGAVAEAPLCWGQQWPWNEQQRPVEQRSPSLLADGTVDLLWGRDLRGRRLTPELARQVLRTLVERHEVLRSTFRADDGGAPRQLVWPVDAEMFDLVLLGRGATDAQFRRAVQAGMDLAHRWPIRLVVHARSPRRTRVGLVVHHVAADLHAFEQALAELRTVIDAAVRGVPPDLPPPGLQPREIAAFEQSPAGAARNDRALHHWLGRRADLESVLGRVRARFDEPAGSMHVARATSSRATPVLARQAKEQRVSPAAVVTAAVARVLGTSSGARPCRCTCSSATVTSGACRRACRVPPRRGSWSWTVWTSRTTARWWGPRRRAS